MGANMSKNDYSNYHFMVCGISHEDGSIKIFDKFESFDFATMALAHYVYHGYTDEYYFIITETMFNQSILIGN